MTPTKLVLLGLCAVLAGLIVLAAGQGMSEWAAVARGARDLAHRAYSPPVWQAVGAACAGAWSLALAFRGADWLRKVLGRSSTPAKKGALDSRRLREALVEVRARVLECAKPPRPD